MSDQPSRKTKSARTKNGPGPAASTSQQREDVAANDSDDFDPSRLRLSQDFASQISLKKVLTTVPVRKPHRQAFIRVHPDAAYRLETALLEVKEANETYLVDPSLWGELAGEITPKVLFTVITQQKVLSLWPVRLPGIDGRLDDWNRSALEAAERARSVWLKLVSNRSLGAYEIYEAAGNLSEPEWPELSFQELLEIAFKDHFIRSIDHPELRRLRGEI